MEVRRQVPLAPRDGLRVRVDAVQLPLADEVTQDAPGPASKYPMGLK